MEQRGISIQTIAVPIVALMIMTLFFYYAKPILVPVVLGIVFAFILNPAIKALMRLRVPRVAAVITVVVLTLIVFLSLAALITAQAGELVVKLPAYWAAFQEELAKVTDRFPSIAKILPGVELNNGLIQTKDGSLATSRPGVFAGGDLVRGPSTVVAAVADGMAAANEINEFLRQ